MSIERPQGGFRVLYADPAWSYEMFSEKGHKKSPHEQYDCMSLQDIKDLRQSINMDMVMAKDSVCIMWAVFPMLPQALEVMEAWGFEFKTGGPWVKTTKNGKAAFGTGYIYRSAAELFLVGVRGKPKALNRNTRNLIWQEVEGELNLANFAQRREHSRKPGCMYLMIESLFPGPYLELFARHQRESPNWTVWGNQTDRFEKS